MAKTLRLGAGFALPLDFATEGVAVIGMLFEIRQASGG